MATELTENLKKSMKSERDAQIISLAVKPWSNDPFLKMPLSAQNPGSGKAPERPNFIYSGFVVAGDKKMALINGVEYMVGEQLETGGYFVSEITPDYVMIEDANHRDKQKITYEDPSFFVRE